MSSVYDKIDLPDRLDPMTVKEIRQGLRRGSFLIPFIAIHVFAIAAMVTEFYLETAPGFDRLTGVMQLHLFFDFSPFWWVAGVVCMIGMPLGALALMTPEMEEGNYELLQMTTLSRWKIVLGKLIAMWMICLLTFSSLMPYMIIRYFIGGMDVWRNFSMALTVILLSGVVCSGSLAASSYKGTVKRILVMLLFALSAFISGVIGLTISAYLSDCGISYHLNAFSFVICYMVLGLVMARSKIRLTVTHYEVKPSWMVIGILLIAPIMIGISTIVTAGFFSTIGFIATAIVAFYSDKAPKAPAYMGAALTNIPTEIASVPLAEEELVEREKRKQSEAEREKELPISSIKNNPITPNLPIAKKTVKIHRESQKSEYKGWR